MPPGLAQTRLAEAQELHHRPANFTLPAESKEGEESPFKEITFTELEREEAAKLVEKYNKDAKEKGFGKRQDQRNKRQRGMRGGMNARGNMRGMRGRFHPMMRGMMRGGPPMRGMMRGGPGGPMGRGMMRGGMPGGPMRGGMPGPMRGGMPFGGPMGPMMGGPMMGGGPMNNKGNMNNKKMGGGKQNQQGNRN